jgi:Methyltransferase domain
VSLRFHEISEARHRILNPFTEEKLDLLGRIVAPAPGQRHLDLACGKAEMLCRWARDYGTTGVGVDISTVFLPAARARAEELGVAAQVTFVPGDAGAYESSGDFDIVSCIGATWIGGGLVGTLELMRRHARGEGDPTVLVGEPYWIDPPPEAAYESLRVAPDDFTSLIGTVDRIEAAGFELVEMVLADGDSWDRYVARQWLTVHDWLRAHPDDPDADELAAWTDHARRSHMEFGRRYFGWGVFAVKLASAEGPDRARR